MCFQFNTDDCDNLASVARTGRKTTKYKRGTEAVWSPKLERALLDGLQQYVPPPTTSSRHPRQLQRFPGRNKYISAHILRETGVYRSAKQVGSRLQQLRETSTDTYILFLIKDKVFGPNRRRISPSYSPSAIRSLRSSPSTTDISDYPYDYRTPIVTPSDVEVSMEQQQEDAFNFLQTQHVHAPLDLIWEYTPQAFSDPAPECKYQQQEPCLSVLGPPFGQQELVDSELQLQQLSYAVSMADISSGYGASFTAPEYDISIGTYGGQQFPYENASALADVDPSLYAFSPDTFTILDAAPNTYLTTHLTQSHL